MTFLSASRRSLVRRSVSTPTPSALPSLPPLLTLSPRLRDCCFHTLLLATPFSSFSLWCGRLAPELEVVDELDDAEEEETEEEASTEKDEV